MSSLCPLLFNVDQNSENANEAWESWSFRFANYLITQKLESLEDLNANGYADNQKSIKAHLFCLAPIITNVIQRDTNDTYQQIMVKINQAYKPKESQNKRTAAFRMLKQLDGESIDNFVGRLRNAATGCNFTNENSEIVAHIENNARSKVLRDTLELSEDTSLDKVIRVARIIERQEAERTQEEFLNVIENTRPRPTTQHSQTSHYQRSKPNPIPYNRQECRVQKDQRLPLSSRRNSIETCTRCGQEVPHRFGHCPAISQQCNVCGRIGHFGKVCRSKVENNFRRNRDEQHVTALTRVDITPENKQQIQWMRQQSNDESQEPKHQEHEDEYEHIFAIEIEGQDNRKYADVTILGESFKFLIDTGTTTNIMDEITYERIRNKREPLSNTNVNIKAYISEKPNISIGKFEANIEVNNTRTKTAFTVVRGHSGCILGLNTLESLNMITFDSCVFTIDEDDYEPSSQIDETMKTRKLNSEETAKDKKTMETRESKPTAEKENNGKQIEEPEERSYTHRAKEADNSCRSNNSNIRTKVETNKAKTDIEPARVNQQWIVEKKAKSCTKESSSKETGVGQKKSITL